MGSDKKRQEKIIKNFFGGFYHRKINIFVLIIFLLCSYKKEQVSKKQKIKLKKGTFCYSIHTWTCHNLNRSTVGAA